MKQYQKETEDDKGGVTRTHTHKKKCIDMVWETSWTPLELYKQLFLFQASAVTKMPPGWVDRSGSPILPVLPLCIKQAVGKAEATSPLYLQQASRANPSFPEHLPGGHPPASVLPLLLATTAEGIAGSPTKLKFSIFLCSSQTPSSSFMETSRMQVPAQGSLSEGLDFNQQSWQMNLFDMQNVCASE